MPVMRGHAQFTAVSVAEGWPRRTRRAVISVPRLLTASSAPDSIARSAPARAALGTPMIVVPTPPFIPALPGHRVGTVPKLAPGHQGSGRGSHVAVPGAGFQSKAIYGGFTPMSHQPATVADRRIHIPRGIGLITEGRDLGPTYRAHDFAPATRQFNQARSSAMWSQAQVGPQFRPLTPSQQAVLLRRGPAKRVVLAGQSNPNLYTAGYPTTAGAAARVGGGPIASLGYNSQ